MRLSDESVSSFARIYERIRGVRLTSDAAREMATRLLTLFELFCRKAAEKPEKEPLEKHD
jgi:hypothetical protein